MDVTIPDKFANSYIGDTSTKATAAFDRVAALKMTKYIDFTNTNHFVFFAVETGGERNELALKFIMKLVTRLVGVTQKP